MLRLSRVGKYPLHHLIKFFNKTGNWPSLPHISHVRIDSVNEIRIGRYIYILNARIRFPHFGGDLIFDFPAEPIPGIIQYRGNISIALRDQHIGLFYCWNCRYFFRRSIRNSNAIIRIVRIRLLPDRSLLLYAIIVTVVAAIVAASRCKDRKHRERYGNNHLREYFGCQCHLLLVCQV